jgi:hypothetical protein
MAGSTNTTKRSVDYRKPTFVSPKPVQPGVVSPTPTGTGVSDPKTKGK